MLPIPQGWGLQTSQKMGKSGSQSTDQTEVIFMIFSDSFW